MKSLRLLAIATDPQVEACRKREIPPGAAWEFLSRDRLDFNGETADAWFILDEQALTLSAKAPAETPVFVNHVVGTLDDFPGQHNIVRVNAWPGFFEQGTLELCACPDIQEKANQLLQDLRWPGAWTADIVGMLRPRVIAMLVNEACMALADGVSTAADIDKAMKLGTNYPQGPFAWAHTIGPESICQLLEKLSETDPRYTPAPEMRSRLKATACQ